MIRKKRIPAWICLICMLAGILFTGVFSAAESVPEGDNGSAETFVFVNEYSSAGSYTGDLLKAIEGRPFRADEQFVFAIEPQDGAPAPRNADGTAVSRFMLTIEDGEAGSYSVTRSLPVIPFTNADLGGATSGTFTYHISEIPGNETYMTYDPEPRSLTLRAVDEGDGTITVTRVSGAGEGDTSFTNIYARTCSAAVAKTWDDADNQDGKRPEALTVELHRRYNRTLGEIHDGASMDEIVEEGVCLKAENGWRYRKDNLPCWDRWGNAYSYYWKEYILTGESKTYPSENAKVIVFNGADYTCETQVTDSTEGETPLTETALANRHAPALTDRTVCKIWDDKDNEQGMRPQNVTVALYANNRPTGLSVKLGAEAELVNSNTSGTYSAVALGNGGAAGTEPFKATLKNLPVYVAGVEQEYSWLESDRATDRDGNEKSLSNDLFYSVTEYSVSGDTTTVTNRYDTQTTSLSLVKVWEDAEDRNGVRPESVQVTLRAVNGNYERSYTLSSENGWRVLATDLPRILDGQVLEYEWIENPVPEGYVQSDADGAAVPAVNADATGERIATAVNKLPMGTLKVKKEMTSDDGKIPANEMYYEFTVTRTAADGTTEYMRPEGKPAAEKTANRIRAGETVTFENLSLNTYRVTELGTEEGGKAQVEYYTLTAEAENGGTALLDADGGEAGIVLTNTYIRKRGSLAVAKKVSGVKEADKAGKTFRIRIRDAGGEYYLTDGTTGPADKAWTEVSEDSATVWTNLPYGVYTVEEDPESAAIDRYVKDVELSVTAAEAVLNDENGGEASVALQNVYLPMLGALEITKEITGTDATGEFDALRIRIQGPDGFSTTVTYDLFRDGKYTLREIPSGMYTLTEENADSIADRLILRSDSVTAVQTEVTRGETTAVKLTNNYNIVTTTVTVRKVWDDRNNQDGIRPNSVLMTLSNGMTAELNAGNGWTASIGNLPLYDAAGNAIVYTWTEPQIRGYRQQSVTTEGSVTTFVNTHTPEVTSATVVKVWDDADNAAGIRPANLRVTLSNGSTYYLNEGNRWTVTVNDLPAYAQGKRIQYTWSEQSVLGYTSTSETKGNVTTFINHCPSSAGPENGGKRTIRLADGGLVTIEDLPTPLGLGGIINHVGDTFE